MNSNVARRRCSNTSRASASSRLDHSGEILGLLDRLEEHDPAELVARIVEAEQFVALPGHASVEDQQARRQAELLERWRGLRAWFVGDQDSGSPWRTLNDQVVDAIRAVLRSPSG